MVLTSQGSKSADLEGATIWQVADKYTQTQHPLVSRLVPVPPTLLREHIDSTSKPKVRENYDPIDPRFNRNALGTNPIYSTLPSPEIKSQGTQTSWETDTNTQLCAVSGRVQALCRDLHTGLCGWGEGEEIGWKGSLEGGA